MRATIGQPFGNDLGIGVEDDGQVGPVSLGIELPEEGEIDPVEALHHQTGREVAVAQHHAAGFKVRPDFHLKVVVAVGRVQAGQRVTRDRLGHLAAELPDRPRGRLGRDVDIIARGDEKVCQVLHDGRLPRAARPVH